LSPAACFSDDHYAGIGSPSPNVFTFKFDAAEQPSSTIDLLVSTAQTSPSTNSPANLQLCADLSSYPLQQLLGIGSSSPCPAACQHHMVLRSTQPKTDYPQQLPLPLLPPSIE